MELLAKVISEKGQSGSSNEQSLKDIAAGFNNMAKALEKVGEAVGQKIKIPPVVVNQQQSSPPPKPSPNQVAKFGNAQITSFRETMEVLRPVPA